MGNVVMNIAYGSEHEVPGPKPTAYDFLQAYTISSTFIPAATAWYKVYCFGRCGNGVPPWSGMEGRGGGGSGGLAVSELWLKKGVPVSITITTSQSKFGDYCYATAGNNGSGQSGGSGGRGYNGNIANLNGFRGGDGGNATTSANGRAGADGENGGMGGGAGGGSGSSKQPGGSGGGGGARVPGDGICKYVAPPFTSIYRAGGGGPQGTNRPATKDATPYPALAIGPNLQLYGGGGGGGGAGWHSSGRAHSDGIPGVVIIEQGK